MLPTSTPVYRAVGFEIKDSFTLPVTLIDNTANLLTPCQAYQQALNACQSDILIYVHDDVTIHDPDWLARILRLFENPNCVAVGPGGAVGLGNRDLYRKRFDIRNMVRIGYASNQDDWQVHGGHFTEDRRVAVLEQFLMAIRVDWLQGKGGWPVDHLSHHGLDMWVACEAARDGKEIWQCGFSVLHSGGGTSVTEKYKNAAWLQGGSMESDHQMPHRFLMREYADVLPIEVDE